MDKNKLCTPEEVAKFFMDSLTKAAGGDKRKLRGMWYDLQTKLGGFPANRTERARYIRTGRV